MQLCYLDPESNDSEVVIECIVIVLFCSVELSAVVSF